MACRVSLSFNGSSTFVSKLELEATCKLPIAIAASVV